MVFRNENCVPTHFAVSYTVSLFTKRLKTNVEISTFSAEKPNAKWIANKTHQAKVGRFEGYTEY